MSTYFLILACSLVVPLLLSFDRKVAFYKKWKYLFPSLLIVAIFFIIWDIWFTKTGIWSFNEEHLSGIKIFNLPMEECLFFIVIPYSSIFTYEVIVTYKKNKIPSKIHRAISVVIIFILLVLTIFFHDRMYPLITYTSLIAAIIILDWILKANYLGYFYLSYAIIILPFLLVNGLLTGYFTENPVVIYNNAENMGIRIFTIPFEDIFYGMLLLLLNVGIYEGFKIKY